MTARPPRARPGAAPCPRRRRGRPPAAVPLAGRAARGGAARGRAARGGAARRSRRGAGPRRRRPHPRRPRRREHPDHPRLVGLHGQRRGRRPHPAGGGAGRAGRRAVHAARRPGGGAARVRPPRRQGRPRRRLRRHRAAGARGPAGRGPDQRRGGGAAPTGLTPIGRSLEAGAADLPATGDRSIILVSDGIDECGPPTPARSRAGSPPRAWPCASTPWASRSTTRARRSGLHRGGDRRRVHRHRRPAGPRQRVPQLPAAGHAGRGRPAERAGAAAGGGPVHRHHRQRRGALVRRRRRGAPGAVDRGHRSREPQGPPGRAGPGRCGPASWPWACAATTSWASCSAPRTAPTPSARSPRTSP